MPDQMTTRFLRRAAAAALATVVLLISASAAAQQYQDADALMAAVDARPEPSSTQATLSMTISTASGQRLTREMQMWGVGDERRLIKFTAPADIAGSGFLTIEHADGSEERLVYLPALGRVRRIAGGQGGDSFFGSDFSYQDITGIDPEDYDHTLLSVGDGPVYLVEAIPTAASESSYERLLIEVQEATLVPTRIEYYQAGELSKVLTVSDVSEIAGYLVAGQRRMESLKGGSSSGSTVIVQTGVTFDEQLPDELFTERYLSR